VVFLETPLRGAFVIDLEPNVDERGFFARTWCEREFTARGLSTSVVQCNVSFNARAGTLRGLHYQAPPYEEIKVVRCIAGAIFDVIVDLRTGSPTYSNHYAVVLSAANKRALYVPAGFAQGFETLENDTEVAYQISEFYRPEYSRGVRWNDPAFGIAWPATTHRTINSRDEAYPDFQRDTVEPERE
jgi:dTDP-4-dehydrorhamnose 3,5-epimerase